MLKKLGQSLSGFNKVAGIELVLRQDELPEIHAVILSLKNNILSIDKKITGLKTLNDLKAEISSDIPVSLVINGKGILHKKMADNGSNTYQLIQQVLPNAKASDFYIQFHKEDKEVYISLVRKNLLEPLLKDLKENGLFIVSLSIGPFAVINTLPLLGDTSDQLSFSGHNLLFNNSFVKDYKFIERSEYKDVFLIDKEPLEEFYLCSYASAFQLLYSEVSTIEVNDQVFVNEKEEFKYKKVFKMLWTTLLSVVLFILLVNVFLFQKYFDENQTLAIKESHFNGQLLKLDSLEIALKEKERFFNDGWKGNSRISYNLDKLASTLPSSLRLTILSVSPFNEKIYKTDKKLEFALDVVTVTGICKKSTDLNPWIKDLKAMDFIKDVKIQSYFFDNKEKEGKFNLEIYIK